MWIGGRGKAIYKDRQTADDPEVTKGDCPPTSYPPLPRLHFLLLFDLYDEGFDGFDARGIKFNKFVGVSQRRVEVVLAVADGHERLERGKVFGVAQVCVR